MDRVLCWNLAVEEYGIEIIYIPVLKKTSGGMSHLTFKVK